MNEKDDENINQERSTSSKKIGRFFLSLMRDIFHGILDGFGGKRSLWRIAGFGVAVIGIGLITNMIYDRLKPSVAYSAKTGLEEYANQYNKVVMLGVDPRDIEGYLKKLSTIAVNKREDTVEKWYQDKEIELPLREAMLVVLRNMDAILAVEGDRIERLQKEGSGDLAKVLTGVNEAFQKGDVKQIPLSGVYSLSDKEKVDVYMNVAEKYESIFQLDKAEEYYEKARTLQKVSGTETAGYASTLGALGNVYYLNKEYDRSRIYFGKAIGITQGAFEDDNTIGKGLKKGYQLAQQETSNTSDDFTDIITAKLGNTIDSARSGALYNAKNDIPPRLTGEEAAKILKGIDPSSYVYTSAVQSLVEELQKPLPADGVIALLGESKGDTRSNTIFAIKDKLNPKAFSADDVRKILNGIDSDSYTYTNAVGALGK